VGEAHTPYSHLPFTDTPRARYVARCLPVRSTLHTPRLFTTPLCFLMCVVCVDVLTWKRVPPYTAFTPPYSEIHRAHATSHSASRCAGDPLYIWWHGRRGGGLCSPCSHLPCTPSHSQVHHVARCGDRLCLCMCVRVVCPCVLVCCVCVCVRM